MADETFRSPGQPRMPEVPGGTPGLSQPPAFPNPPAVNSAPAGRPPQPAPVGDGAPLPLSRPAPAPTLPAPSPSPSRPTMPSAGPQLPTAAPPPMPGASAGAPTAPPPPPGAAPSFQMDRVPTSYELASLPPGTTVTTPYGSIGADGKLVPNAQTQARYQQAIVQRRKQFGPHPFANDPNAPPAPVELGKPSFNPFTGQWME